MAGARLTDTFQVIGTGEVAGSASAAAFPTLRCRWVRIKAAADNTGKVYLGNTSGVTKGDGTTDVTSGYPLSAGEEVEFPCPSGDMDQLYRICDNATDDVFYIAYA